MANLVTAVALDSRTVRVTFSAPLTDFGSGATGALNPSNWTFDAQVQSPVPVAPVETVSVAEVSTTVLDVLVDDDLSPEQLYQIAGKPETSGGILAVADAPNNKSIFQAVGVAFPPERNFDALKMVPAMNLREDDTQDLERFLRIINDVLKLEIRRVDLWTEILDLEKAPENFLDLMLRDLAYPLQIALTEVDKRRLLSVLATIYRQKGTVDGLKNAIRFFVGYESDVLWPDRSDFGGWILDVSELDFGTVLGDSFYDPTIHGSDMVVFAGAGSFTFWLKIGTPGAASLTADEDTKIRAVVDFMKPAHTHMIGLSTVLPPPANVTATPGAAQITVAYDAVSGATDYIVFWSKVPVVSALSPHGDIDAASPLVESVPTGQVRYYRVVARSGGINGVASARVNATAI